MVKDGRRHDNSQTKECNRRGTENIMTCGVSNCTKPDITTFKVRIKTESGELKDGDVRVCSEHEKQFIVLQKGKERFCN